MTLLPIYGFHKKYNKVMLCLLLAVAFQTASAQDERVDTTITVIDEQAVDDYEQEAYPKYDEEKEYLPDTTVFREVPDSVAARIKREKAFAYANDATYWMKEREKQKKDRKGFWDYLDDFFATGTVRAFAYILIALLFIFVLYRVIVQNKLYLFYFSKKLAKADDETELAITTINIDDSIKKAIAAKDHRAAVRFLYLKTLQLLNDKGWIRLHAQATNRDYIHQMSSYGVANQFRFLTEAYDYVWYGEFKLTDAQFDIVYTNFRNFFESIK